MGECSNHKKVKEIAEKLNGIAYGENVSDIEAEAKEHGIVIVMGASDDLMEFSGAINDEGGCFEGGTVWFNKESVCCDNEVSVEYKNSIIAKWCNGEDESGNLATWSYETTIPNETFKIWEDGELYCIGLVFSADDLK